MRAAVLGFLAGVWTALPGIVISFNAARGTVDVQPAIQGRVTDQKGNETWQQIKRIRDCPVVFYHAGNLALTLPLAAGDEVLLIFSARCIDSWFQSGGVQIQSELRMHDLSDGFAIPGPFSLPNVLSSISTTAAQLRTKDGSAYIELTPAGVVNIKAPGGVNINGATVVTGSVNASGDVQGNGHSLSGHIHGGVQSGGSNTSGPIG